MSDESQDSGECLDGSCRGTDDWLDEMCERYEDLAIMPGYNHCILGVGRRCGETASIVYDEEKVIDTLMKRDGMSHEEAVEFFEFNQLGAWIGDSTPIFLSTT